MNLDKNLLKKLGIFIAIIVLIFIGIFAVKIIIGQKLEYSKIENKLVDAAKSYYKKNPDDLPKENGGYVTINVDKLVENGNIKNLSDLVKDKDAICTGEVTVTNNNGLLLYSPLLNCGDYYESKKLKTVVTENVVTSKDGIYNINNAYIFKGEKVNNYVSFAGLTWRILRVNNDGTIRMIETTNRESIVWDDRYNSEREYDTGINNFRVSRIKESLEELYNSDTINENDKAYIVNQNICIGKREPHSEINDGSIECSDTLENQPFGLLQPNEFVLASLDENCKSPEQPECTNYNYLTYFNRNFWTQTGDKTNTYKAFKVSRSVNTYNANSTAQIRLVIHINANVNYISGDGSEEKPYVFK